ncbi:hypothetical protein MHN79_13800 [Vibrio sp. Of14-4]|uniref:hypothetical protein n=1 Tax=Vibrio sp. Of14-4 TaxID=2724878 RepID=UPI001EF245EF|nr:hypothetical protein [Vibrio sp. Of14-4]MCG7490563.1 hypothetical protein [Vibrio sp. Of14-4]
MVNRIDFTFEVSGVSGTFKVQSFQAVSSPFEMNLTVLSVDDSITFDTLSLKIEETWKSNL